MSCPDCFRGQDHSGVTNGHETKLYGINTYVTEPPASSNERSQRIIVIFSDAFGWGTVNLRRLADSYAFRTGCCVYLPDFMYGTAVPAWVKGSMDRILNKSAGVWETIMKPFLVAQAAYYLVPFSVRNSPPKRYDLMVKFMSDLRNSQPIEARIGVAGFCWGAYATTHMAKAIILTENGRPLVDAAYTAHPSEVTPNDFAAIKIPYSLVVGDIDFAMKIEQVREAAALLATNKDVASDVLIIPGARHGFAVRGNPNDPKEKEMADRAEDQAVKWFNTHL